MTRMLMARLLLVVILLPGLGAYFSYKSLQTEFDRNFSRNFAGFRELETYELYGIMDSHSEIPVRLSVARDSIQGTLTIRFTLSEASSLYLSASADSAPTVLVQPLILTREDGRRFLLPLIRSSVEERRIESAIRLGRFEAGEHTVLVSPDASLNKPIPDSIRFSATRPSYNSQLAVFIEQYPVIEVKNHQNLLDDIPLMGYSHLYRRGGDYLMTSHLIFSSENGGTKPPKLMSMYQRTVDVEWVMRQVFTWDDGKFVPVHRQFQGRNHSAKKFEGEKIYGVSPVLSVATPNNNFSDNSQTLLGFLHFSVDADAQPIVYAPKPLFMPAGKWSQYLLDLYPELQRWSLYEVALERCVDLLNQDDPAVQQFQQELAWIQQYLTVEFPNRGCGDKLVQPPDSIAWHGG